MVIFKVILLWCKLYVDRNIINYKSSLTFRNLSPSWKYKLNLVMIVCFNVLVVPVLFQHSLKDWDDQKVANLDHIFDVEPLKITSPSSDAEVALALRVLEGCCLLHRESSVLAHQHKAIQVIFHLILAASADSFFLSHVMICFAQTSIDTYDYGFLEACCFIKLFWTYILHWRSECRLSNIFTLTQI